MRIIIVRHGKAEASAESGRDVDRRLRKRGERQSRWLGAQFAAAPPGLILSSPHERAIATARLIHEACGSPLHVEPRLELGCPASAVLELIDQGREEAGVGALMLVGHNPQLGQALWMLTQGTPCGEAELKTGEAAVLEIDSDGGPGCARLVKKLRMPEE